MHCDEHGARDGRQQCDSSKDNTLLASDGRAGGHTFRTGANGRVAAARSEESAYEPDDDAAYEGDGRGARSSHEPHPGGGAVNYGIFFANGH